MSTTLYDTRIAPDRRNNALNTWLWIAQIILGVFFLAAGYMHAFMSIDQATKIAAWIGSAPAALVRFIGVAELAGGVGVLLPAATRIKPWLTPLAAAGLGLIMLLAMPVHIARGEVDMLGRNIATLAIAAFIVWGRVTRVRIPSRRPR
jgi:putative oxidoreductase